MEQFNEAAKDAEGVYYRGSGNMLSAFNDPIFALTHEILNRHEGTNDGIVLET